MKNSQYDISLIRRYLNGELDARAMYELERQAQEDPLLLDLIAGMEQGDETEHQLALHELDELIDKRTEKAPSRSIVGWRSFGIAASVLLVASFSLLLLLRKEPGQQQANRVKPADKTEPQQPIIREAEPRLTERTPATLPQGTRKRANKKVSKRYSSPPEEPTLIVSVPETQLPEPSSTEQVVIVGYGAQKKQSVVGSIAAQQTRGSEPVRTAGKLSSLLTTNQRNGSDSTTVSGVVRDEQGFPIIGASVRVQGKYIAASTDVNGRFTLKLPTEKETLLVSYVGYKQGLAVVEGKDSLEIAMEPNQFALSEVVVVGYGEQKGRTERVLTEAKPLGGWQEFNKYLNDNTKADDKADKGLVILSFLVYPDGKIADVKVVKGLNEKMDRRAIDLLIKGPKWVASKTEPDKRVELRLRFR